MMKLRAKKETTRKGERGYLLVGLLATMTISLVVMAAAMPQLKFESQREREEEMLWRGQQIAMALLKYSQVRANQPPNTLEELVEGVNVGVKKIRFLRPHALCDPMRPCAPGKSNWRLVRPGDPVISSMVSSLQAYIEKKKDDPYLVQQLAMSLQNLQKYAPRVLLPGQGGGGQQVGLPQDAPAAPNPDNNQNPEQNDSGRSLFGGLQSEQGPIVGVVSHSKERPIRTMLDIENYDKELFFAGGVVIAGGFYTPYFSGSAQVPAVNPCPGGGYLLPDTDGKMRCFGTIFDGNKPPSSRQQ